VFFNFDQLNIPNLTGNFSGGNITISGGLPLINNHFSDDSLNISIDSLALDINSLYLGNAQGFINIANSAIAPEISGRIKLYNGEIKVTENLNNNTENLNQITFINTNFKNLQLILGENISINQPPLLNLKAEGSLNINGELNNLKPEGIINLKGGNLNLFTSQLKLANNYNNIAKFMPENGFEPYLDIQLEGSVTETLRYQLANNSNPNEIRDIANSSLNNAQTIRIKANVKGWSNNLENNIKLSSSPQRNQTEIIALLGGGFFNDFGEGDSNLGLANLASAAFLGSVQGQLQKEFGFDQLRLFPTQIFNTENSTSSFALGAELGLNITDNFSVSITKILTNEQAPSYSIRYRLNDQTILRGSSDFEQDSRGVIEFEHRF
jgi:translocation and assembly module TamB